MSMNDIRLQLCQKGGQPRIPGDGYRIIDTPGKIDRRETKNIIFLVFPSLTGRSKDIDLMSGRAESPAEKPDGCYDPVVQVFITDGEENYFHAKSLQNDANNRSVSGLLLNF